MSPEILKLIQQAVEHGITVAAWLVLVLTLAGAGIGAAIGSYLKRKGENYATKEDSAELLRQVRETTEATEAAKLPFAQELASFTGVLNTTLAARLKAYEADLQLDSGKALSSFTESAREVVAEKLAALTSQLHEDLYYKTEILPPRLEAYRRLWALTSVVRPSRNDHLTNDERRELRNALTNWYYDNGDGICLSLAAGRAWRDARNCLLEDPDEKIRDTFSSLKTQLKADIKVYGEREAGIELGV